MTTTPCTVDEDLTLADAADRMAANKIRHLVVVRDHRLVGMVSRADLEFEAALAGKDASRVTIKAAMQPALTCAPNTPLPAVALQMEAEHRDAAVVVDEEDMFVMGIFTATDALRALREVTVGHEVEPAVLPQHEPPTPGERGSVAHWGQARAIVRAHHAMPTANDGALFGKVFT